MGNVVPLRGLYTTIDSDPEDVLKTALEEDLQGCVILGYTQDGREYFSSSFADGGKILWLTERIKHLLIDDQEDKS